MAAKAKKQLAENTEEEEIIDIDAVNAEIAELKAQIAVVEAEMDKYLEELGLK